MQIHLVILLDDAGGLLGLDTFGNKSSAYKLAANILKDSLDIFKTEEKMILKKCLDTKKYEQAYEEYLKICQSRNMTPALAVVDKKVEN